MSPSLPFSEVALASQVVGFALAADDGATGGAGGLVVELSEDVVCPPLVVLFSFRSFEQPALMSMSAVSKDAMLPLMIRCSVDGLDMIIVDVMWRISIPVGCESRQTLR